MSGRVSKSATRRRSRVTLPEAIQQELLDAVAGQSAGRYAESTRSTVSHGTEENKLTRVVLLQVRDFRGALVRGFQRCGSNLTRKLPVNRAPARWAVLRLMRRRRGGPVT